MNVNDLKPKSTFTEIYVRVIQKQAPRRVKTKRGRQTYVNEILIGDETGTVIFSLWGWKTGDEIHVNQCLKINDGWVSEYLGTKSITFPTMLFIFNWKIQCCTPCNYCWMRVIITRLCCMKTGAI